MRKWKEMLNDWRKRFVMRKWKRIRRIRREMKEINLVRLTGFPQKIRYRMVHVITQGFRKEIQRDLEWILHEGIYLDGTYVAVKQFTESSTEAHKQFCNEIRIHSFLRHKNILRLHGICAERSHRILLFELAENGSLDLWLFCGTQRRRQLNWRIRKSIALQIAQGLQYLHEFAEASFVHADLNPANIFLDEYFNVKIGGFGMSLMLKEEDEEKRSFSEHVSHGSAGYKAPDRALGYGVSTKIDVFSFGVILLDMVCGRRIYSYGMDSKHSYNRFAELAIKKVRENKVEEVMDRVCELEEKGDKEDAKKAIMLGLWCLQRDPSMRPSVSLIVLMLQGHVDVQEALCSFLLEKTSL